MSMISEQVNELRTIANNLSIGHNMPISLAIEQFRQAADTIESLSAKLAKVNMERSERYYNGGWIPCSYSLPSEKGKYWITYFWGGKECVDISEFGNGKFAFEVNVKADVVAWMPCVFPEPYKAQ